MGGPGSGGFRGIAPRLAKCGHLAPYGGGVQRNLCPECKVKPRCCRGCGDEIVGRPANARYCSTFCSEVANGRRKAVPFDSRTCALDECGVVFVPTYSLQRCCSELHGKRHYNRMSRADGRQKNPVWDERRRANWKKRYALTRGAEGAETFDYLEVYERDGWICGECRQPVDSALEWPHPLSVSLDHIVPVSLGGEHTRKNAQCAHLVCNVRKGARAA